MALQHQNTRTSKYLVVMVLHPQSLFFPVPIPHTQNFLQIPVMNINFTSPTSISWVLPVLQASCRSVKGLLTGPVVTVPLPTPLPPRTPGAEDTAATRSWVPAATEPTGCAPGGKGTARRSTLARLDGWMDWLIDIWESIFLYL